LRWGRVATSIKGTTPAHATHAIKAISPSDPQSLENRLSF